MTILSEGSEWDSEDVTIAPILQANHNTNITAQEGDDVTFSVTLSSIGGSPHHVHWTRGAGGGGGGGSGSVIEGDRFIVEGSSLRLRGARPDDADLYKAVAINAAGESAIEFHLDVHAAPGDVPRFVRRLNDLAVKVGTRTRLLVEIRSTTDVKTVWFREDREILQSDRHNFLHEGSFFCLDVTPVTLEDSGIWSCIANNANGRSSCSCRLNVLVPKAYKKPEFVEELKAVLTEGGTVSLECKVIGVPTPHLRWFKDGEQIKAGDVFALSADPSDPTTLGTYTCEATNCMGRAVSSSRVHVNAVHGGKQMESLLPTGPVPKFSECLQNEKVKIGGTVTLQCKVEVPPWPSKISWFNSQGEVQEGDRYHLMADGLGAYSCAVDPVEVVDQGQWKCVASSALGLKSITTCNVSVAFPKNYRAPRFLECLRAVLTEEGLVSFECKVVGYPTPHLQWFKDGQELKPGDVYQLTGTNSLGSYCCIARNCMGEAKSTAELTVEDIQSQLSEEEKLQLSERASSGQDKKQPPRFLIGLKSIQANINEPFKFSVQVTVNPEPVVTWYRDDEEVQGSERVTFLKETHGVCHLNFSRLEFIDQAEWKCVATNDYGQSVTSCFLKLNIPKHFKKPRFLECLRAVLSEEGAVNLECKVIGVPQPTLKWYKDGRELKPGDIHKIISGEDGTCCLGVYTCEAHNCMGTASSSASLLGFEDRAAIQQEAARKAEAAAAHVQALTRQPSLSTIQEERTSQLQEVSFSFDGKEVSVSLYETPDLTEEEALQIVEMYAEELSEHVSEHNVVELPPMRFVKETSTSGHILMEAVVIDVSPEYYASAEDDMRTDADLDEFSISEEPVVHVPNVFTHEDIPYDKLNSERLERSEPLISPLSETDDNIVPKKLRKKDSPSKGKDKDSDKSSSGPYSDALASEKEIKSLKDSFASAVGSPEKEISYDLKQHIELETKSSPAVMETNQDLMVKRKHEDVPCKVKRSKSRSQSKEKDKSLTRSKRSLSRDRSSDESHLGDGKDKRKHLKRERRKSKSESEIEDDSLQEFERRKILDSSQKYFEAEDSTSPEVRKKNGKIKSTDSEREDDSLVEFENRKTIIKDSASGTELKRSKSRDQAHKRAMKKRGSTDSSSKEDDSLVEYEKRKTLSTATSSVKTSRSKKGSLNKKRSSESSEKEEEAHKEESEKRRKKKSIKQITTISGKETTPETGVEIFQSSETDSVGRGIILEAFARVENRDDGDETTEFDTAEDSAYDKSEMSVLESLTQSLHEIQKGLAMVEEHVISESSEEPETAKSSLSVIESLVQPINELKKSIDFVEKQIEEESLYGEYSPSKAGLTILETLAQPVQEFERSLALVEQQTLLEGFEESLLERTSQSILETVAQPLQEFHRDIALIQQQAAVETTSEAYSDVLQSFKSPFVEVQGGVLQSEKDFTSKIEDLSELTTVIQPTYAEVVDELQKSLTQIVEQSIYDATNVDSVAESIPVTILEFEKDIQETETFIQELKSVEETAKKETDIWYDRLDKCIKTMNEKIVNSNDDELQHILKSLRNFEEPLRSLQNITNKCITDISENSSTAQWDVRPSSKQEMIQSLTRPFQVLNESINLLEKIAETATVSETRGLGIASLYKLSIPIDELKTTIKLVENLSSHTAIEFLSPPVENMLSALSTVSHELSKEDFIENIPTDGENVIKGLDDSLDIMVNCINSIEKYSPESVSIFQKERGSTSLYSLIKPLEEFQKNLHSLQHEISDEEKLNNLNMTQVYHIAQELGKPLHAIRIELSIIKHQIELDEYSSFSLQPSDIITEGNTAMSNLLEPVENVQKSVSTFYESIVCRTPEEPVHIRYVLHGLKTLTKPVNGLCSSIMKTEEQILQDVPTLSEPSLGLRIVTQSVHELRESIESIKNQSHEILAQPEIIIMSDILSTLSNPLSKVEDGLISISEEVHEEDKTVLNINLLKTMAEPFKVLQKALININSEFSNENISEAVLFELKQPIQELQRSILVIQDQVSFEYGDEPTPIESNIVTLQSLIQPMKTLKRHFINIQKLIAEQNKSKEIQIAQKIVGISKVIHKLQLKVSSLMVQQSYFRVSKHTGHLELFPALQYLVQFLNDFERASNHTEQYIARKESININKVKEKLFNNVQYLKLDMVNLHKKLNNLKDLSPSDCESTEILTKAIDEFIVALDDECTLLSQTAVDEASVITCLESHFDSFIEHINNLNSKLLLVESKITPFVVEEDSTKATKEEKQVPKELAEPLKVLELTTCALQSKLCMIMNLTEGKIKKESDSVVHVVKNMMQSVQSLKEGINLAKQESELNIFKEVVDKKFNKSEEMEALITVLKNEVQQGIVSETIPNEILQSVENTIQNVTEYKTAVRQRIDELSIQEVILQPEILGGKENVIVIPKEIPAGDVILGSLNLISGKIKENVTSFDTDSPADFVNESSEQIVALVAGVNELSSQLFISKEKRNSTDPGKEESLKCLDTVNDNLLTLKHRVVLKNIDVDVKKVLVENLEQLQTAIVSVREDIKERSNADILVLDQLLEPLKEFSNIISNQQALKIDVETLQSLVTENVTSLERVEESSMKILQEFAKVSSDLELGLMKVEHNVLNASDPIKGKTINIEPLLQPIQQLSEKVALVEEMTSETSEYLGDQLSVSLSMLKTLAQPIREIQNNILTIQQQTLETTAKGESGFKILEAIAKPIREIRTGVALIQEQAVVMEADAITISDPIKGFPLEEIATPLQELKNVLNSIIERQELVFEPSTDPLSEKETLSELQTVALPMKELQKQLAEIETQQILEGSIDEFSIKEVLVQMAKPIIEIQQAIATIEKHEIFETIEKDISIKQVETLKKLAKPLLEVSKGIACMTEQLVLDDIASTTTLSDFPTLASSRDISLEAAVEVHQPIVLEYDRSLSLSPLEQETKAKISSADSKMLAMVEQPILLESVIKLQNDLKTEKISENVTSLQQESPLVSTQQIVEEHGSLKTPAEVELASATLKEFTKYEQVAVTEEQKSLSGIESLKEESKKIVKADVIQPVIEAILQENQQTLSQVQDLDTRIGVGAEDKLDSIAVGAESGNIAIVSPQPVVLESESKLDGQEFKAEQAAQNIISLHQQLPVTEKQQILEDSNNLHKEGQVELVSAAVKNSSLKQIAVIEEQKSLSGVESLRDESEKLATANLTQPVTEAIIHQAQQTLSTVDQLKTAEDLSSTNASVTLVALEVVEQQQQPCQQEEAETLSDADTLTSVTLAAECDVTPFGIAVAEAEKNVQEGKAILLKESEIKTISLQSDKKVKEEKKENESFEVKTDDRGEDKKLTIKDNKSVDGKNIEKFSQKEIASLKFDKKEGKTDEVVPENGVKPKKTEEEILTQKESKKEETLTEDKLSESKQSSEENLLTAVEEKVVVKQKSKDTKLVEMSVKDKKEEKTTKEDKKIEVIDNYKLEKDCLKEEDKENFSTEKDEKKMYQETDVKTENESTIIKNISEEIIESESLFKKQKSSNGSDVFEKEIIDDKAESVLQEDMATCSEEKDKVKKQEEFKKHEKLIKSQIEEVEITKNNTKIEGELLRSVTNEDMNLSGELEQKTELRLEENISDVTSKTLDIIAEKKKYNDEGNEKEKYEKSTEMKQKDDKSAILLKKSKRDAGKIQGDKDVSGKTPENITIVKELKQTNYESQDETKTSNDTENQMLDKVQELLQQSTLDEEVKLQEESIISEIEHSSNTVEVKTVIESEKGDKEIFQEQVKSVDVSELENVKLDKRVSGELEMVKSKLEEVKKILRHENEDKKKEQTEVVDSKKILTSEKEDEGGKQKIEDESHKKPDIATSMKGKAYEKDAQLVQANDEKKEKVKPDIETNDEGKNDTIEGKKSAMLSAEKSKTEIGPEKNKLSTEVQESHTGDKKDLQKELDVKQIVTRKESDSSYQEKLEMTTDTEGENAIKTGCKDTKLLEAHEKDKTDVNHEKIKEGLRKEKTQDDKTGKVPSETEGVKRKETYFTEEESKQSSETNKTTQKGKINQDKVSLEASERETAIKVHQTAEGTDITQNENKETKFEKPQSPQIKSNKSLIKDSRTVPDENDSIKKVSSEDTKSEKLSEVFIKKEKETVREEKRELSSISIKDEEHNKERSLEVPSEDKDITLVKDKNTVGKKPHVKDLNEEITVEKSKMKLDSDVKTAEQQNTNKTPENSVKVKGGSMTESKLSEQIVKIRSSETSVEQDNKKADEEDIREEKELEPTDGKNLKSDKIIKSLTPSEGDKKLVGDKKTDGKKSTKKDLNKIVPDQTSKIKEESKDVKTTKSQDNDKSEEKGVKVKEDSKTEAKLGVKKEDSCEVKKFVVPSEDIDKHHNEGDINKKKESSLNDDKNLKSDETIKPLSSEEKPFVGNKTPDNKQSIKIVGEKAIALEAKEAVTSEIEHRNEPQDKVKPKEETNKKLEVTEKDKTTKFSLEKKEFENQGKPLGVKKDQRETEQFTKKKDKKSEKGQIIEGVEEIEKSGDVIRTHIIQSDAEDLLKKNDGDENLLKQEILEKQPDSSRIKEKSRVEERSDITADKNDSAKQLIIEDKKLATMKDSDKKDLKEADIEKNKSYSTEVKQLQPDKKIKLSKTDELLTEDKKSDSNLTVIKDLHKTAAVEEESKDAKSTEEPDQTKENINKMTETRSTEVRDKGKSGKVSVENKEVGNKENVSKQESKRKIEKLSSKQDVKMKKDEDNKENTSGAEEEHKDSTEILKTDIHQKESNVSKKFVEAITQEKPIDVVKVIDDKSEKENTEIKSDKKDNIEKDKSAIVTEKCKEEYSTEENKQESVEVKLLQLEDSKSKRTLQKTDASEHLGNGEKGKEQLIEENKKKKITKADDNNKLEETQKIVDTKPSDENKQGEKFQMITKVKESCEKRIDQKPAEKVESKEKSEKKLESKSVKKDIVQETEVKTEDQSKDKLKERVKTEKELKVERLQQKDDSVEVKAFNEKKEEKFTPQNSKEDILKKEKKIVENIKSEAHNNEPKTKLKDDEILTKSDSLKGKKLNETSENLETKKETKINVTGRKQSKAELKISSEEINIKNTDASNKLFEDKTQVGKDKKIDVDNKEQDLKKVSIVEDVKYNRTNNKKAVYVKSSSTAKDVDRTKRSKSEDHRVWISSISEPKLKRYQEDSSSSESTAQPPKPTWTRRESKCKPYFCGRLMDRTSPQGARVKMSCSFIGTPEPTVKWLKDGLPLVYSTADPLADRYETRVNNCIATLEIHSASPTDCGRYTCIASNPFGEATTTATLRIFTPFEPTPVPPTFTARIQDQYKFNDDQLVLECRVTGQPHPTTTWLKDGKEIPARGRYQQSEMNNGTCQLIICGPEPSDSGFYTCRAQNLISTEQISDLVTFQGRAYYSAEKERERLANLDKYDSRRPQVINLMTDHVVPAGGMLALHVQVKGLPHPQIKWFRGLESVEKKAVTLQEGGLYSLILPDVAPEEAGLYTCRASNVYGHTDSSAHVQIVTKSSEMKGKPAMFIKRPDTRLTVAEGEDINVLFQLTGDPRPRVTWMKGLKDMCGCGRSMKEYKGDCVQLTLKRATQWDAGTYFIVAKNIYGSDRAFFTVYVRQRARSLTPLSWDNADTGLLLKDIHEMVQSSLKDVPGPVDSEPIVTDGGRSWLTLSWSKPRHQGAAPILAYRVEAWRLGEEGGARWDELGVTPISTFDAFELKPGASYKFRVTARNRFGWGEPTVTREPIVAGCQHLRPEIVTDLPGQLKALQSTNLTLQCEIRGEPQPDIRWYLDGRELAVARNKDDRISVKTNGELCSLLIRDLHPEDSGRYICEATNKLGRASTFVRLLIVQEPRLLKAADQLKRIQDGDEIELTTIESPPQFSLRLRDRRVQTSYPVRLTCQVVGYPTPDIAWFKEGERIYEDDRHSFWSEENFQTLEISRARIEDNGQYNVTAQNEHGSVSCYCQLIVDKGIKDYVSPGFLYGVDDVVTVNEGKELRLRAQVEAYPAVGITWHRDGIRLRQSRRLVITLDKEGRTELSLADVTPRDAGVYCCTAVNEVGRAETSCQVIIQPRNGSVPQLTSIPPLLSSTTNSDLPYTKPPMFLTKPRSTSAAEGDTVVILCEVLGDPKPEVIWLRDWLKPGYYRDAPQFLCSSDGPQYRLEIPHVKLDFTGAYCVLARNEHGEARAVISLQVFARGQGINGDMNSGQVAVKQSNVQTLPEIVRELKDIRCCDGDSVTLECKIYAQPLPETRWLKDGKILTMGGDIMSELDGDIARLTIKKVYPEDEGEYTCMAYNELGRALTSACLVVDVPEEKEVMVSRQLVKPPGFLSTPSTPRTTSSRSISPGIQVSRDFTSPITLSTTRTRRAKLSSPKFYAVPHNRVAEQGETVRFQCSVAGHPIPWASWDKDGHIVASSARYSVLEQDDLRMLQIKEVTPEDAGLYRVTLENDYGSVEATARLEVIAHRGQKAKGLRAWSASRASPTFGRRLVGSAARVGGTFTLSCDAQASPSPVITWYRNGEVVVRSMRITPLWDGRTARLKLKDLDKEDAGVYTCVAENELGRTRCSAELVVLDVTDPSDADLRPPVFITGLPELTPATEGHPFELQVKLLGTQPLEVVWVKDDAELPDCMDFRYVDYGDGRFGLRIADVFTADAGIYACEAFNPHGDAITSGRLEVVDTDMTENRKKQLYFTKTPTPLDVEPGNSASFCARIHSPADMPMHIIWSVAGQPVLGSTEKFRVEQDGDSTVLRINSVTSDDIGPVNCRAHICSDGHKEPTSRCTKCYVVSCTSRLAIMSDNCEGRPAILLQGPEDTTALRGQKVVLKAVFCGHPQPTVRWLKAGRELSSRGCMQIITTVDSENNEGESSLVLDPVSSDDSGKYVVSVENCLGADCHFASVAVEGPPDPPAGRPSAIAMDDNSVTIAWSSPPYDGGCMVTGYRIEMKKSTDSDWTVVADRCHSLSHVVHALTPGQHYAFRVRAENVHGASHQSIETLSVLVGRQLPDNDEVSQEIIDNNPIEVQPGEEFVNRFEVLEELGKGRYGVVHRVLDRKSNSNMAAKFVRCIKKQDRQKVHEEIDIMNCLRHPKLLQLTAAYENSREVIMVMEYITGGELFERVVADDFTLTERDCILFMRQICEGVEYMHQNSIVHLDLKPENIMCHTRTSHQIKVIDFGLAQKLSPNTTLRALFGTPEFIPPEIINYEPIGIESDMWSLGVICYVLLSGLSPFMGDNDAETFANITRADFDFDDEAFDAISQDSKDFISGLLVKRKEKRMSATQCLQHKWMSQCDTDMSYVKLSTDKLKKFIIRRKWQLMQSSKRRVA